MNNKELSELSYIRDIISGHNENEKQDLGEQLDEILSCATDPDVIRQCEVVKRLVIESLFGCNIGEDICNIINKKD